MRILKRSYLVLLIFGICITAIPVKLLDGFSKGIHPWLYLIGFDIEVNPLTSSSILSNKNDLMIISYGKDYHQKIESLKHMDLKMIKLPLLYFFKNKAQNFPSLINRYAVCQGLNRVYPDLSMFKVKVKKYHPEIIKLGLNIGQSCSYF